MSSLAMSEERISDHNNDEYELTGLKNVQHDATEGDVDDHDDDTVPQNVLDSDYNKYPSESSMNQNETEHFLLRLVNVVKSYPDLFESSFYPCPSRNSKRRMNDLWSRVRMELMWQGVTPIDVLWKDLLEQYTRRMTTIKTEDGDTLSDRLYESMHFMRPYLIGKLKGSGLHHHTSTDTNTIDYNEMPQNITEDVMISGCNPVVSHSGAGYVVVQPQTQRTRSATISSTTQSMMSDGVTTSSSSVTTTPQTIRYASVGGGGGGSVTNRRIAPNIPQQQTVQYVNKRPESQILHVIKKDENNGSVGGTMTMMVDMTTYYHNVNGQKMYRLLSLPSSSQQQQQQIGRNVQTRNTNSNIDYDLPPEPLIEGGSPESPVEPPRKKLNLQGSSHLRGSANRVEDDTIVAGGIPIGDDEIIDDGIQESTIVIDPDGHLHEESPLLSASPDVMISGQSARSTMQTTQMGGGSVGVHHTDQMPSTSSGTMHHHHQQQIDGPDDLINQQSQYDADLQFQQLISSHLSRLNDDDKALMKYNMQRILLDARFGEGTSKQILLEEEILETEDVHGDLESQVNVDDQQIQ